MVSEKAYNKIKRAVELQSKKRTPEENEELKAIMSDPYIYDKVEGLKMGGII